MSAHDEPVRTTVLGTPGIADLLAASAAAVAAFLAGPSAGPVTVADGCAGGRHRAPVFAQNLANRLLALVNQELAEMQRTVDGGTS